VIRESVRHRDRRDVCPRQRVTYLEIRLAESHAPDRYFPVGFDIIGSFIHSSTSCASMVVSAAPVPNTPVESKSAGE